MSTLLKELEQNVSYYEDSCGYRPQNIYLRKTYVKTVSETGKRNTELTLNKPIFTQINSDFFSKS